jgi:hypothetical protein
MSYLNFISRGFNLDCTFRCPLMCPNCARQTHYTNFGKKVQGKDIDIINFIKIIKYVKFSMSRHNKKMAINFEGQYSDPVHHPNFLKMLELCFKYNVPARVQHSSSAKPHSWYIKAFKINPLAIWNFSIDGLPKDSHKYRINQNGEKLFNVMKESTKHLHNKPSWQYIIFNYNENDINEATKLANEIHVNFYTVQSGRWNITTDNSYMPSEKYIIHKNKNENEKKI